MKIISFILFACLLFFISCNAAINKSEKKEPEEFLVNSVSNTKGLSVSWSKVDIKKLPFTLPSNADSILYSLHLESSLENYYKIFAIPYIPNQELDTLFNGFTELQHKPWDYVGKPSGNHGHFFARLPDINNNKIVLFAVYDDTIEDYTLGPKNFWLELQTFNKENEVIDKMIIYAGFGGECSFNRDFIFEKDAVIRIRDRVICRDTDKNATILSDTVTDYIYTVQDDGKIIEKRSQKQMIEGSNIVSVNENNMNSMIENVPTKNLPLIDSTSFSNYGFANKLSQAQIQELKIGNKYKNIQDVYLNYKVNLSKEFTSLSISCLISEYELMTTLINYDNNNNIIDAIDIAYDEIAESALRKISTIKNDRIIIEDFNYTEDNKPKLSIYKIDNRGHFIK